MASEGGAGCFGAVPGLLGVAFVVLKLCAVIDWSWWLVTLPFWGPAALALLVVCCCLTMAAFVTLFLRD